MKLSHLRIWTACLLLVAAGAAHAKSPFPVVIGPSRDGSLQDLQRKVDKFLGVGRVNVRTDYVGAHAEDPDPWYWINPGGVMYVELVDRKSPHFLIGWYREGDSAPSVLSGESGVIAERWKKSGMNTGFRLPAGVERFGFYVDDTYPGNGGGHSSVRWTNRAWNSPGPDGLVAAHAPFDGDPQLLVYDVSRWLGPHTWLVACEISDSGRQVGHGKDDTDNDYSDVVFTVSGVGVTPTRQNTFGRVKALFR